MTYTNAQHQQICSILSIVGYERPIKLYHTEICLTQIDLLVKVYIEPVLHSPSSGNSPKGPRDHILGLLGPRKKVKSLYCVNKKRVKKSVRFFSMFNTAGYFTSIFPHFLSAQCSRSKCCCDL